MRTYIVLAVLACTTVKIVLCDSNCSIPECTSLITEIGTEEEKCRSYKEAVECLENDIIYDQNCPSVVQIRARTIVNRYKTYLSKCCETFHTCNDGCSINKCRLLMLENVTRDELCVSYNYAEKCVNETIINNAQCSRDVQDQAEAFIRDSKTILDTCENVTFQVCGKCDAMLCACAINADGTKEELCQTLVETIACLDDINNAQCLENEGAYLSTLKTSLENYLDLTKCSQDN